MDLVGKWTVIFIVDFVFEARVPRPQSLDTVFHRHRQFSLMVEGNRPLAKKCYACARRLPRRIGPAVAGR